MTKITVEGTGELLHEGPTVEPRTLDDVFAEIQATEKGSYRRPIATRYGEGWYDVRRPWRIYVENTRTRPVG